MRIRYFLIVFLITLFSVNSLASGGQKGHMVPLPSEKLEQPVKLKQRCSNVSIIEWRGSSKDAKSIKIINDTCNLAVSKFNEFISTQKGYHVKGDISNFGAEICLIPLNSQPRNMNDIRFRFFYQSIKVPLWGYYQRAENNVYMRSDVLVGQRANKQFITVLAHELFHAMSYKYGILKQHSYEERLADKLEEKMAQDFTEFIGLGR